MKGHKHRRDLFDVSGLVHIRVQIVFQVLDPNPDLKNQVVSLTRVFTGLFVELTVHTCHTFLSPHKQTLLEEFLPEEFNPPRASKETRMDFCLFSVTVRGFD